MADINDIKNLTVSHGTLNPDHLIPAFCDVLKEYAPDKYAEFIKGYPELDDWEDFLEADWRIISDDTKMNASDDLFGLLNDIAPEGTMFSTTEGDGADFGFWSVEEKLLDDDEGEQALKQMAKDGKSTGEVAADIRYDVATALDMAADKAEDLMSKFGLDKIYVLRAKGLSPKAIANKILKACEPKDEAARYYGYGKDDAIDKEDNDFMWQVAYDWFVDKLPEKLAQYADKAVIDVIDKDSRAYEEIVTMDDYYDYLETYGPAVIEEITGDLAESKKTESSGAAIASIYGDGDGKWYYTSTRNFDSDYLPESKQHENRTKEEEVTNIFKGMKEWADRWSNSDKDRKTIADNLDLEAVQENMSDIVEILDNNFEWDGYGFKFVVVGDYEDDDTRDEAEANQWNRCYDVCEEIADLIGIPDEGHVIGEMNIHFWEEIEADWRDDDSKPAESKKSESLTLKQKELKDMARYGEAEDITTISDAEAKELKKKGIETVGVSRGTYGMNGALLRDREGNKYVITARSSNLFYFV